jgi:hypothetical protein
MKKALLVVAIILFSTIPESPVNASTEGCPDTWNVDLTRFPNNPELIQAKKNLGPKMVETQLQEEIIKYSGELGDMPVQPEIAKTTGLFRILNWYLFGKSEVLTTWKVEVKDCLNPGIFKFRHLFSQNGFSEVQESTAEEWSKNHENFFVDFKKQQSFAEELLKANLKSQVVVDYGRDALNRSPDKLLITKVFPFFTGHPYLIGRGSSFHLQALTPGCVGPSKIIRWQYEIVLGKTCKFAWSVLERVEPNSSTNSQMKLVLFEPFTIDASYRTSTITCIKGKLTQKVTALKPSCPAGYKIK